MQQIAAFEAEPQAEAVASTLREHGYEAEVTIKTDRSYDDRMKSFFGGKPSPLEMHAFVTSNADSITFARAVQHHYGHLVQSDIA
jgi:hypothetical protein